MSNIASIDTLLIQGLLKVLMVLLVEKSYIEQVNLTVLPKEPVESEALFHAAE